MSLRADELFAASPHVRYVALYRAGELELHQRDGLADASAGETDRFEELLVNPAVLTLARQRGEIDCGGLDYVLIRYGNFFQLVHPLADGHASIAIEPGDHVLGVVEELRPLLAGR